MMDKTDLQKLAAKANTETWALLNKSDLQKDERVQMLCSAYSSLYLWAAGGGTSLHFARGHWLISRVFCVLQEPNLAEHHAGLCQSYTKMAMDRKDFDDVYALEAQARVLALKGDLEKARQIKDKVLQGASQVNERADREIVESDVRAEPWFGL